MILKESKKTPDHTGVPGRSSRSRESVETPSFVPEGGTRHPLYALLAESLVLYLLLSPSLD